MVTAHPNTCLILRICWLACLRLHPYRLSDRVDADYRTHSRAARELAGDHFAAERVLAAMMAAAGL